MRYNLDNPLKNVPCKTMEMQEQTIERLYNKLFKRWIKRNKELIKKHNFIPVMRDTHNVHLYTFDLE